MKQLISRTVAIFLTLLCLPDFASTVIAQSSTNNPIMIIRCRQSFAAAGTDIKTASKMVDNPCGFGFKLNDNGGCVPDCNFLRSGESYIYNPITGICDCEESVSSASSCFPFCFETDLSAPKFKGDSASKVEETCPTMTCPDDVSSIDSWMYSAEEEACYTSCFNGEIAVEVPELDCSNPVNNLVPIEICFTSADSVNNPLIPGQSVPFAEISNCLDETGNAYLDLLSHTPNDGEEYFFSELVGADGKLCIEFYVDINEPLIINFTNSNLVVIPTCFDDPCGCDNLNIVEGGTIVRFFDHLTNLQDLGSATSIRLLANNNPQGFTDAAGTPIPAGTVLATIVGGVFEYDFYRASGEKADIELEILDASNNVLSTQSFVSALACYATDCESIPTIGQWGLMILALLLSSLGLVFMSRREIA